MKLQNDFFWLALCALLATGEAVGFALSSAGGFWSVAAALTIFCAVFGYGYRVRGWDFIFIFLFGLTIALATADNKNKILIDALECSGGKPYTADAIITSNPFVHKDASGKTRLSVNAKIGEVKIRAIYSPKQNEPHPKMGEHWAFTGWLAREPMPNRDVRMFWMKGNSSHAERLPDTWFGFLTGLVRDARDNLSRRAGIGLEHDPIATSLNRAILLGERSAIDPEVRNDFIAAGTIHLFAISGLHVMFIAYLLRLILSMSGLSFRVAGGAVIPLLWLYAWITGFPPSAVRATLMASFYFSAPIFWRRPSGLISWSLTFLIVHTIAPSCLFDVGCRLSFTVMLAILAWSKWGTYREKHQKTVKNSILQSIPMTIVAWAAGVPIGARIFHRFTLGGLIANPLLLPIAAIVVTLGIIGCFASFISISLAKHLNNFAALGTRVMSEISALVAKLPYASQEVAPWTPGMCAAWYVACILAIYLANMHARRAKTTAWLDT